MRIATILAALALTAAAPAPAIACAISGQPSPHYFETPPADLAANELVLEVGHPEWEKINPPSRDYDGATWLVRFKVVKTVRGKFEGDTVAIIFWSGPCQDYLAPPANGATTGLLVGFIMPASPEWMGPPGLALRYPGQNPKPQPPGFTVVATFLGEDPSAMLKTFHSVRNPAAKKLLYDRATSILRERADAGDASAMTQLGLALRQRGGMDFKKMMDATSAPYVDPARDWIVRAAALGDPEAMYQMSGRRMMDPALPVSERLALQADWLLKAAEAGHACAMGRMADNYRVGRNVEANKEQALAWRRKAIAAGAIMSPYGYELEGAPPPGTPALQCPGS